MSSAFDYYSETKTGFGFNLKPVLLNRMRPKIREGLPILVYELQLATLTYIG